MQITLNQADIEQALIQFISNQGVTTQNANIDVSFTTGRKGNSRINATLDIRQAEISAPVEVITNHVGETVAKDVEPDTEVTDVEPDAEVANEAPLFGG